LTSSGFILVDSYFRPIYANQESIKILGYPNPGTLSDPKSLDELLSQKILSIIPTGFEFLRSACALQFRSGRRSYHCRAFVVEDHWKDGVQETRIALLMERGLPGPPSNAGKRKIFAGMHEDPFGFISNPGYYYFSRAHQNVFKTLLNMIHERRGIGVVFAQSGMGKTALLNYLGESLRSDTEIAMFPGSFQSRAELVRSVMAILGVQGICRNLSENLQLFEKWLLSKRQDGRSVLLICDEAQDLDRATLQNLCLFSRLERDRQKLLQIVLAGRQELLVKLTELDGDLDKKMINVFCRLVPFDYAEVGSYILHRLSIAGCNRQLFSPVALSSIALYSRGVPLNINMLCRHCLSLAASVDLPMIDERLVADSAYDLVLRAQPASAWDVPDGNLGMKLQQSPGCSRDRRGLRLVRKP
jgi:general secretion pathway protein A